MRTRKRYFARNKLVSEIHRQLGEISKNFAALCPPDSRVEVVETDKGIDILLVENEPVLFKSGARIFPTVKGALKLEIDRHYLVVDKGAVSFVTNGADIMRPGVVDFDHGIKEGDILIVVEETHRKPLAVAEALWSGARMERESTGKCAKNIHRVGDDIWNAL